MSAQISRRQRRFGRELRVRLPPLDERETIVISTNSCSARRVSTRHETPLNQDLA